MQNTSSALRSLYTNGGTFQLCAKLQVLDRSDVVLAEFVEEIIDGRVTVNGDRPSVREFQMTLANPAGIFTWGPGKLIWLDKRFKVWSGVMVNGAFEWIPLGVYPCTKPTATSRADGKKEVRLQGSDKMAFWGKCPNVLTVPAGTSIPTAIKSVLSGIESNFLLDPSCTATAPYDMTWPAGTEYQEIVAKLASIPTWKIYYDANGALRFRPPIDPTTTAPSIAFDATNARFNLFGGSDRECDDSILANRIQVFGGSAQTALVSYELKDTDPKSPTAIQNIGERLYQHNNGNPDPVITSVDLAIARANYEYRKRLQVTEKLHFACFCIPFLEQEDIISVNDPANGSCGRYQLMNFTIPLFGGEMSGELWQVRSFAAA